MQRRGIYLSLIHVNRKCKQEMFRKGSSKISVTQLITGKNHFENFYLGTNTDRCIINISIKCL